MSANFTKTLDTLEGWQSLDLVAYRNDAISKIGQNPSNAKVRKSAPSIGLEQEFFLLSGSNVLASHAQAQSLFLKILEQSQWKIAPGGTSSNSTAILSISREIGNKRYTKIKFESPPHMLEIAFGWYENLNDLAADVELTWRTIENAASQLGLFVSLVPFGDHFLKPATGALRDSKGLELAESRARFLTEITGSADTHILDFTKFTAGTQVHIGGIDWFNDPTRIEALYSLEPVTSWYSALLASQLDQKNAIALLIRRKSVYDRCFPTFPLIGVPDFPNWTLEAWVDGMLNGPLTGKSEDPTSGRALARLPEHLRPDITEFLLRARDFQYVRPRISGTIEFRADGALPDPSAIISVAALRFAVSLFASKQEHFPALRHSRHAWIEGLSGHTPDLVSLLSIARSTLAKRALKEERFIL